MEALLTALNEIAFPLAGITAFILFGWRISGELGGLRGQMIGMEKRFDGVEKRLDGMEKRLDGMEKRLDKMDEDIRDLRNGIAGLDDRLRRIETAA